MRHTNYFLFSIRYLILTTLIYAALIAAPWAVMGGEWLYFIVAILSLSVCLILMRNILMAYFIAANKPKRFAEFMTVITVFPPVIGPIIVLVYSLDYSPT